MTAINPGDFIVLKSGGPTMTVSHLGGEDNDYVTATWWNEDKKEFVKETFRVWQVKVVPQTS